MDPAAPYFGRHRVLFREVFHPFCVLTFRMYLDFSCALAFRTYLSETLLAVVAVTEQSALGHAPSAGSATLPVNAFRSELAGTLKSSPVPDINRENSWAISAPTVKQADGPALTAPDSAQPAHERRANPLASQQPPLERSSWRRVEEFLSERHRWEHRDAPLFFSFE